MELTNREWSVVLWLAFIFSYALWKAKPWRPLKALLKQLVNKHILILFGSMAAYIACCTWLLSRSGAWSYENLKSTLLWAFGFGLVTLFQIKDADQDSGHFRKIAKEAIGVNVFVAFLASTYTFSLPIELLLVPIAMLASAMLAVAGEDPKTASVRNLLNGVLILVGGLILCNALYLASNDVGDLASTKNAKELLVPILLTFLYVPFLYSWHLVLSYEAGLGRLRRTIKEASLSKYAGRQALIEFKWDVKGLRRWLRHVALFRPDSVDAINASIAEIKTSRRRERNPFRVPPPDGWLPEHAKKLLADEGLETGDYYRNYDGWRASSPYLSLGSRVLDNNIAYYIEGDEWAVRSLRLVLNVNYPDDDTLAIDVFQRKVSKLISRAIYGDKGENRTILLDVDGEPIKVGRISVSLKKEEWLNKDNGYELVLDIEA